MMASIQTIIRAVQRVRSMPDSSRVKKLTAAATSPVQEVSRPRSIVWTARMRQEQTLTPALQPDLNGVLRLAAAYALHPRENELVVMARFARPVDRRGPRSGSSSQNKD